MRSRRWAGWSDERLLDARLCDLGLTIAGSPLEPQIGRLYRALERRGIRFRPHSWLSDCWFSPDGIPGFAIPFYLAHPRLAQLEKRRMLELEGGTGQECQKLMRHETAHALANAYRLHLRHAWQRGFGRPARTYPESYLPRPESRGYVINLGGWYAQSHPHEDWAETFAVWLDPRSRWHERYRGWPALRKLELVDSLMHEIATHPPALRTRRVVDPLASLRITLREYFEHKQQLAGDAFPRFHSQQLERIFPPARGHLDEPAARFISRHRAGITTLVAHWTGAPRYRVSLTLTHAAQLAAGLGLRAPADRTCPELPLASALVMLYMGSLRAGRSRLAL